MRVAAPIIGRDTAALALSLFYLRLMGDFCSPPVGVGVSTFGFSAGEIAAGQNARAKSRGE